MVVWAHQYCDYDSASTHVFDRASSEILKLDLRTWVELTPSGLLGTGGGRGAHALLDLDTTEWVTVLPNGLDDVRWSADYRFAMTGALVGHGGYCLP